MLDNEDHFAMAKKLTPSHILYYYSDAGIFFSENLITVTAPPEILNNL